MHTCFLFISNKSHASALKVAYIFKVFGVRSYLMVAQQFDQVTCACKQYNNFQDSKFLIMIIDFKIFPNNPFEVVENWYNVGLRVILRILQLKYSQNCQDKSYNIFQTTCFNHTMIFFKLTDQYKFSNIYTSHHNCLRHMLITQLL